MAWSTEARAMIRPAATYANERHAPESGGPWLLIRRPLILLFCLASFVAVTSTGQFTPAAIVDAMIMWSWLPLLQLALISVLLRVFGNGDIAFARAVDLFFVGHSPFMLLLIVASGACLLVPAPSPERLPITWSALLALGFITTLWCNAITVGFFTSALDFSKSRAIRATLTYSLLQWGVIIAYLMAVQVLLLFRVGEQLTRA